MGLADVRTVICKPFEDLIWRNRQRIDVGLEDLDGALWRDVITQRNESPGKAR